MGSGVMKLPSLQSVLSNRKFEHYYVILTNCDRYSPGDMYHCCIVRVSGLYYFCH